MSGLARDGTAAPVSRDQILRRERGQRTFMSPVQLTTSKIGGNHTRSEPNLLKVILHTQQTEHTELTKDTDSARRYFQHAMTINITTSYFIPIL